MKWSQKKKMNLPLKQLNNNPTTTLACAKMSVGRLNDISLVGRRVHPCLKGLIWAIKAPSQVLSSDLIRHALERFEPTLMSPLFRLTEALSAFYSPTREVYIRPYGGSALRIHQYGQSYKQFQHELYPIVAF